MVARTILTDVKQLARPYYVVNLILALSFLILKLTPPMCDWLFEKSNPKAESSCELDMRENEVDFESSNLLFVQSLIRNTSSRFSFSSWLSSWSGQGKLVPWQWSGNQSTWKEDEMINLWFQLSYLSSGFTYAKVANQLLFFRADPRMGLIYLLLFILQAVLLPEPTYKGPENIVYFRFARPDWLTLSFSDGLHIIQGFRPRRRVEKGSQRDLDSLFLCRMESVINQLCTDFRQVVSPVPLAQPQVW